MTPPRFLSYREARDRVLSAVRPLPLEPVALAGALGRALGRTLVAPHPLPPFPNSAMDGFAVRTADLAHASGGAPVALRVAGVIAAGQHPEQPLAPGECLRIMTGAMPPPGADAIVPLEEAEADEAVARFVRTPSPGEHVREAGADLAADAVALEAGRELSAHDLALLGALGYAELSVGPRPRIAVLSTGDELLDVGAALVPGAIRDSNLPMLALLAESAGGTVAIAERLPDEPERVGRRIEEALAACDVVLTIGGVSAGDFDPVKLSLARIGDIELWRVAMRPGRPQAFGAPRGRLFFGLPGNPASVACVFEALVRPALRRLAGHAAIDRPHLPMHAAHRIESKAGRTDFVRVTLEWRASSLWATAAGAQISGHLTPQSHAHALLIVPESVAQLDMGDEATGWLLRMPDAR